MRAVVAFCYLLQGSGARLRQSMVAVSAEDSLKAQIEKLSGNAEPTTKEGKRLKKLQAAGIAQDKIHFIERAWASAERFGLQVSEETGQIVGGIPAIDGAFRKPENRERLGVNDVAARIRFKQQWKAAGIIGE
jgi:hypothetical protein